MSNLRNDRVHESVAPVTVGASATTQVVTRPFGVTGAGASRLRLDFYVGAVVAATGVTCGMQQSSGYNTWSTTKTTSVTASTAKTLNGLVAEVFTIVSPTFAAAAQADYIHVTAQDGSTYAVWFDKDAAGTAPTGALYTAATNKIEVDIVTGDTAAQVAAKVRAALVANSAWAADFTTSAVATATITVTQVTSGAVANPAPKSENDAGAGSIGSAVTTAGDDGDIDLSTNILTSATHTYSTDDPLVFSSAGTLPTGLEANTIYYAQVVDADTYKLRTRRGDATSVVDITSMGTGVHSSTLVRRFSVTFNSEVAGDQGYLPLSPLARGYITSGASDSCQVLAVHAIQAD